MHYSAKRSPVIACRPSVYLYGFGKEPEQDVIAAMRVSGCYAKTIIKHNNKVCVRFVDYEKASDSVNWQKLNRTNRSQLRIVTKFYGGFDT